jgi:DNA polymerase elongation subunit (family B)
MDPLLFGHNEEENIVAVQQIGDGQMRVYRRMEGSVIANDTEFYPFFFLSDPSCLKNFSSRHWVKELAGRNFYRYICAFTRWSDMWDAVRHVIDTYNETAQKKAESYAELPILHLRPDALSQFLMQTGRTLFKGMEFENLYRLQLDIETYSKPGFKYSNANRPEDRIILIALSDNRGWEYIINGKHLSEKEMLNELIRIIIERDPDAIEGHNIYGFDIPYILKRCDLHGIEFNVGRDGSAPHSFESRTTFAERAIDYISHEIPGRHIIDTWLLVQSYDVSKRALESYGLKYVAQYFGFAKPDRIYIKGDRISWYWDNEPDLLVRYALDDVHETRQLSEYLSPSAFYLSQIVPFSYGTLARIGSAAKIEALFLREYIRQKHSVPKPESGTQTTGGYTDIFQTGILGPIIHVDVESLYPSIMLRGKIAPRTDALNVFLSLLEDLTDMRLAAKREMKRAQSPIEKAKYDAMQSSYKILINSFYGYLGYARGLFNDYESADKVTQSGQRILRQLIGAITERHGTVVEVDTDGILFVPPGHVHDETTERTFVEHISKELPEGINLSIDGRYKKMLSYKMKNYALLGYDNKITIKGSSLISRNMKKFGKHFIEQCIDALLNDNIESLHTLYVSLSKDISGHKLSVADFAKTETLKDSIEQYSEEVEAGRRNRTASYEVAISSSVHWKQGDKISYYITGSDANVKGFEHCKLADEWDPNFPDENIQYYLKRLDEFSKKFEIFFEPRDFRAIFSVDDLFPFSAQGIKILTLPVQQETVAVEEDVSEEIMVEPKIWLDEQ